MPSGWARRAVRASMTMISIGACGENSLRFLSVGNAHRLLLYVLEWTDDDLSPYGHGFIRIAGVCYRRRHKKVSQRALSIYTIGHRV